MAETMVTIIITVTISTMAIITTTVTTITSDAIRNLTCTITLLNCFELVPVAGLHRTPPSKTLWRWRILVLVYFRAAYTLVKSGPATRSRSSINPRLLVCYDRRGSMP